MTNVSLPEITLDELARLVRILGLLGSAHDGEILNAARLAQRWVVEHQTDWETLLVPAPEPAVLGVSAVADPDLVETATDLAYQQGHSAGYEAGVAAGLAKAMAQVKAQASYAPPTSQWASAFTTMAQNRPGSPYGPGSGFAKPGQGPIGQGPVRAPGTVPAGGWAPGSWQWVCQELLAQHAAVPGVLRSREEIFVTDILRRGFSSLTPAQEHWLRDIAGRNHMSW